MDDLRELDLYAPGFVAFDATVRLGSFTAAAEELNVTQPTISYRIQTLEKRLGITLFLRRGRATDLTFEGRVVLGQVRETMSTLLASARAIKRARNDPNTVTVLCSPSFATHWILPRLERFKAAAPDVKLRILTTDMTPEEVRDTVDLWFTRGTGTFPGRQAWRVCRQLVTPVCAPSVRSLLSVEKPLDDLARVDLIDLNDPRHPYLTWSQWALISKRKLPNEGPRYVLTDYGIAVKAALSGNGLMLGWSYLVLDYLREGRLVAPTDQWIPAGNPFWLAQNEETRDLSSVNRLREVMLAEAASLMEF
ncbi:MAG TPA: LysR substrate-binding domain-containing protein [Rhizobiaceae bacterium]|nr:LysR substrate-binding domain-containing protein [Rhizobiaceae bacterium]